MLRPEDLICPKPEGLYCPPGDFYIDPVRPVDRAVDHPRPFADHARAGHGSVAATPETLGDHGANATARDFTGLQPAAGLRRDASSATVWRSASSPRAMCWVRPRRLTRWKGHDYCLTSGDYKRRRDATCAPFEPVPVRRVHHRGDLWPAGVPPSTGRVGGDRQAAAVATAVSRAGSSGGGLRPWQGPAGDQPHPPGRLWR